jgi:hypothetical protein
VLALYLWIAAKDASAWPIVVAVAAFSVLILVWLASFRLVLTAEAIWYTTLLRTRVMRLSDIERAEIQVGVTKYRDRFRPTVRLELHSYIANARPLIVNLKVFTRDGLAEFFRYVPLTDRE